MQKIIILYTIIWLPPFLIDTFLFRTYICAASAAERLTEAKKIPMTLDQQTNSQGSVGIMIYPIANNNANDDELGVSVPE